jgi:peptidoglycan/xylan/chitin deacetylase (PgdA/CDA1 family)
MHARDAKVLWCELLHKLPRAVRAIGNVICECLPIWLWRRVFPERTLCMCYHMVSNVQVPHVKHYPFLSTAEFESDLLYLKKNFGFISYEQMVKRQHTEASPGDMPVCLSFDDGFSECFSVVRPVLLHHGAPCIFFIVTDLIDNRSIFFETHVSLCMHAILTLPPEVVTSVVDNFGLQAQLPSAVSELSIWGGRGVFQIADLDPRVRPLVTWLLAVTPAELVLLDSLSQLLGIDAARYMRTAEPFLTTEQILQLRSDGFTIGAHSRSHRRLQELSPADAEMEIVESCRVIQEITGQSSVPFAFPYFGGGIDRTWLARLQRQHDVVGLFFDTQGLRPDAPFVVQRVFGERVDRSRSIRQILRKAWCQRISLAGRIHQEIPYQER